MVEILNPAGVGVILECQHMCMVSFSMVIVPVRENVKTCISGNERSAKARRNDHHIISAGNIQN